MTDKLRENGNTYNSMIFIVTIKIVFSKMFSYF